MLGAMIFALILLLLAGVFFFKWFYSDEQVAKRELRSTPICPIGEATDGERVRIRGKAVVKSSMVAPLSGRQCAVWWVVVQLGARVR